MSTEAATSATIAFLVPDGIGVRNYLYSELPALLPNHRLLLMHNLPQEILNWIEAKHPGKFTFIALPELQESRKHDIWRRLLMFAQLHINSKKLNNPSIGANWLFWYTQKGSKKRTLKLLDRAAKILAAFPLLHRVLEQQLFASMLQCNAGKNAMALLQQYMPAHILCTHQRSIEAGYVMNAANKLGINTSTVIFSWDNLPKSRINYTANHYLVWSNYMQQELLHLYPSIESHQVHVTGTPQFDYYYQKTNEYSYETFAHSLGFPKERKAICFSGNEPSFPSDHLYLEDICAAVAAMDELLRPIILIRPSPNDHSKRLDAVASKYPGIAVMAPPMWQRLGNRDWESNYPTIEDGAMLQQLTEHASAVINVGSTMGIDFAHANKPAMYIRYNHPKCPDFDITYGYQQDHFKTMNGIDAALFIDDVSQWTKAIAQCLQAANDVAKDRLEWKKRVTNDIANSAEKIAAFLQANSTTVTP